MKITKYEELIINTIKKAITKIIESDLSPNITATGRVGAQISDYLEEKFYEYISSGKVNYLCNPEKAPKDKTKNPWDARCNFLINGFLDDIWIDFKAIQITRLNSNPDIGTPNKIINFIKNGKFYLLYVYVYYEAKDNRVYFVKDNNEYTKAYLLKDINHTFRRNPKNQLQVNVSALPETRTREDFIKLLCSKIRESHQRQINISKKALSKVDKIENELIKANNTSENMLAKLIENL
uniref:hypothetical protein n=1 Tax=Candidatus Stercorousia sp. TaxID=3048886 RepID=UPI004028B430